MKNIFLLGVFVISLFTRTNAQVGINADASAPNPSAGLDVKFNDKGLLPPRMSTTQMNSISSPPAGLIVYNTTLNSICWFNGTSWDIGIDRDNQNCGSIIYGTKTYSSVIIGMQCWMTENLNIGTAILAGQDQINNGIVEKYCYNNNSANCDVYGGLYQWAEMVQYLNGATNTASWNPVPTGPVQGICPAGWHLPTDDEWTTLTTYLGGTSVAGGKMKETGITHWMTPNTGATNSSGFTALPGGYCSSTGGWNQLTTDGYFRSASESSATYSWYRLLSYYTASVTRETYYKAYGFSVRCLKD
jgi:uncharacterized protein (TIGR02145 family)